MRILIAEDDAVSRKTLKAALTPYGECHLAEDGEAALKAYGSAFDGDAPFDLICLDIMMPGCSGLDVLKTIRQQEAECGIGGLDGVKIVMTTALEGKQEVLGAFKLGCEAYILKPIELQELATKLAELGIHRK